MGIFMDTAKNRIRKNGQMQPAALLPGLSFLPDAKEWLTQLFDRFGEAFL
jgi:hypothetical protein